ncbi:MAG: hypothetical protein J7L89_01780, partial [Bacteroidales bacterium]|nr:hypothetical protein [Bacteroidales bacterium]
MKRFFQTLLLLTIPCTIWAQVPVGEVSRSEQTEAPIKGLTAGCGEGVTATFIELNNVRALIQTGGDMW